MYLQGSYSSSRRSMIKSLDWWIIGCYLALIFFGWINIYASIAGEEVSSIFNWGCRSGKQFVWILTSLGLAGVILFLIPPKVYETVAPILYAVTVFLLIAVIFVGTDIKGSHSWFKLGPVSFQPAEISKIATSLMLAAFMCRNGYRMKGKKFWLTVAIILLPMLIIVAEKETGSALVYIGFIFMLYREGLSGWFIAILGLVILLFILTITISPFVSTLILLGCVTLFDMYQGEEFKWWIYIGIPILVGLCFVPAAYQTAVITVVCAIYAIWSAWRAFRKFHHKFRWATLMVLIGGLIMIFSAELIFEKVLKDYQRGRIEVLLGMKEDIVGTGYNVHQSKIAIGSGGLFGKGFCQGTQTAYGFVPEQSTDFIFCTVGEEWGFMGCLFVILLYGLLIWRIIIDSEHSRESFTRIYGYCLAACLFMHLFINVGMTLGLMPVIGIPLPFMSYGGSSIWAFTIMLFIFVALDRNERKYF